MYNRANETRKTASAKDKSITFSSFLSLFFAAWLHLRQKKDLIYLGFILITQNSTILTWEYKLLD